jgi:anaerobic selenocysteine-containing dehydrogenase
MSGHRLGTASVVDRVKNVWGPRTPHARGTAWPVRVDQELTVAETDVDRWVQSACVLCSNGCACDIAVKDGKMVGVRGRGPDQPRAARPQRALRILAWSDQDRLTHPLVRTPDGLQRASWDEAMDRIVEESRMRHPLRHGFYTSGQLFLEEYYTLAVIGKGSTSRRCPAPT